ncbi:MAG: phosphoglycerate kinase, partial [Chloroflexota bacterium]
MYATDAFGTLHRAHASVTGVPQVMGGGSAGFLVEREIEVLSTVVESPPRPFVLILGGAKISTKLPILRNMLPRVDTIVLGGAMALTILAARGEGVGESMVEEDQFGTARRIEEEAREKGVRLLLPEDHLVEGPD